MRQLRRVWSYEAVSNPQYIDGWRIDVGPDGVAASSEYGGSLVLFASGAIMSGGCDVPSNIVHVLNVELAKVRGATTDSGVNNKREVWIVERDGRPEKLMTLHLGQLRVTEREWELLCFRHFSKYWFQDAGLRALRALSPEQRRAAFDALAAKCGEPPSGLLAGSPETASRLGQRTK